ncbi:hypothetical protein WN51_11398 [Melipona quadrifasciata]|uniref:Uncharacterized protein n=1 Tax=Melipona quadrifasciata TaxID=166423 RepID=A0A0N0BJX9_9HYME|nr:hypothetical protein WN51_11398 [Melipona quadrifasciata]
MQLRLAWQIDDGTVHFEEVRLMQLNIKNEPIPICARHRAEAERHPLYLIPRCEPLIAARSKMRVVLTRTRKKAQSESFVAFLHKVFISKARRRCKPTVGSPRSTLQRTSSEQPTRDDEARWEGRVGNAEVNAVATRRTAKGIIIRDIASSLVATCDPFSASNVTRNSHELRCRTCGEKGLGKGEAFEGPLCAFVQTYFPLIWHHSADE